MSLPLAPDDLTYLTHLTFDRFNERQQSTKN
jgi:hypothetical protein